MLNVIPIQAFADSAHQGPPPPMPQLQGVQGQHLRVQEVREGK